METNHFYSRLPLHELAVSTLLKDPKSFTSVPENWHVVITDIKNSTRAVGDGLHNEVNLVATGSIIAALNIARNEKIELPFFFGGDGATILVPDSYLKPLLIALKEHRDNTLNNFNLDLRVGHVPVREVYEAGFNLMISKVKITELLVIPIVLGGGIDYAEKVVKGKDLNDELPQVPDSILNLEGMECRWNRVKPPSNTNEVVCLLVNAQKNEHQADVFQQVLQKIDEIYGPFPKRKPITIKRLKIRATLGKINTEMRARLGRFDLGYLLKNFLKTLIGRVYYFPFDKEGKVYLRNLVQLADTLVIDGRINTVISGTIRQRELLREALDTWEQEGYLSYGLHASAESIMSCYVRDRKDQHIHFVDGSEGGYTEAATMLKGKLGQIKKA